MLTPSWYNATQQTAHKKQKKKNRNQQGMWVIQSQLFSSGGGRLAGVGGGEAGGSVRAGMED